MNASHFAATAVLLLAQVLPLRARDPDVIVYGGVPCGTASIAVAREDAKVVLIEHGKKENQF